MSRISLSKKKKSHIVYFLFNTQYSGATVAVAAAGSCRPIPS